MLGYACFSVMNPERKAAEHRLGSTCRCWLFRFLVQEIHLDLALDLDRHRVAAAVTGLAGLHADPAFADQYSSTLSRSMSLKRTPTPRSSACASWKGWPG